METRFVYFNRSWARYMIFDVTTVDEGQPALPSNIENISINVIDFWGREGFTYSGVMPDKRKGDVYVFQRKVL